ncbi:SGNH/GDSL hydrolase family protein [Massilibacteroides vaginae]|uniref:SGNH/GDSL hydrolase family protein n=1 Tax=Massilibacteroides vaginae TaxID=1673718 RepID=UPI000A1CDBF4|nr:GDSL-type esterase/lipase family protein [Massilibacteroides vaginae]
MKKKLLFFLFTNIILLQAIEFNTIESDFSDRTKIKELIDNKSPINWVFTGNSITQGAKHTHGMRAFPEIFSERIRWEMQRSMDFIINSAISGHTTQNILNDFDKRITQFNPKVVVLMLGTNDASINKNISVKEYGENLEKLIGRIRKIDAIPILMTPTIIIIEKSSERKAINDYVLKMREVSRKNNVVLVDNWEIWNTSLQNKYQGEVHKKLLNDPLHPNGYGHMEIAIALFKALSIFDPNAASCGGEYYEGDH